MKFLPINLFFKLISWLFQIKSLLLRKITQKLRIKVRQNYCIELLEEYENVNFYSIKMEGEELTEMEAFFEKFPEGCEYDDDIDVIISWIDQIAERGALERYFRPEGHYDDGVGVIPIEVGNKLRLYCLRLSDKILVFGNGGIKDSRSWQESETLAPYVKLLVDTSRFIASRIKDGTIVLVDKEIVGDLNFTRYEKE